MSNCRDRRGRFTSCDIGERQRRHSRRRGMGRRGQRNETFIYSVTVPLQWVSDVSWHDGRGYTADLFKHATIEEDEDRDIAIVGFTSEPDAWAWQEEIESDWDAFGSSMSREAFQPMRELWDQTTGEANRGRRARRSGLWWIR